MPTGPDATRSTAELIAGTRERLAAAAFDLFATQGFNETTVDQIASEAGLGRRTFFRHFSAKEDVIFPDHGRLLAAVAGELETRRHQPALRAVCDAVRLVLADYVAHRDISLHRHQLTATIPALRAHEVAGVEGYQRLFARYLRESQSPLRAELMSAAVVTAHNHVLRNWLHDGGKTDAFVALDRAFREVRSIFTKTGEPASVVVLRVDVPLSAAVDALNKLEDPAGEPAS
jgi:AcrR family transcriptional regulator